MITKIGQYKGDLKCKKCFSQLEWDNSSDIQFMLGNPYITCPVCGQTNLLESTDDNVYIRDKIITSNNTSSSNNSSSNNNNNNLSYNLITYETMFNPQDLKFYLFKMENNNSQPVSTQELSSNFLDNNTIIQIRFWSYPDSEGENEEYNISAKKHFAQALIKDKNNDTLIGVLANNIPIFIYNDNDGRTK